MTIGPYHYGADLPAAVTYRRQREGGAGGVVTETGQPFSPTRDAAPRHFPVTVVAQDPCVLDADGKILTATVRVPADALEPGPRGHRFHVVSYDASTRCYLPPEEFREAAALDPAAPPDPFRRWRFDEHRFKEPDDATIRTDPVYHALNAYAVAARTLATFESALGRRVPWGYNDHRLFIVPHAFADANAYYSDDDEALFFGYFDDAAGERVYTCLSHDIVAHETAHAILDGLRRRYEEPGLPDQAAFHEAFADIVALLSVFSIEEVVAKLLGVADAQGCIPKTAVAPEQLAQSPLFKLAEQLGGGARGGQGGGLRRSVALLASGAWRTRPSFEAPHRRGEVLVAAVMQTLLRIWSARVDRLAHDQKITLLQATEEGAKSATHLLTMMIRAIDYCPPVEIAFEDFLDGVLVADAEVAPDDDHHYRIALEDAFRSFDIQQPATIARNLRRAAPPPIYHGLNATALRTDGDEVFRFIWQNADLLDVRPRYYTFVDRVTPTRRVGPDGFVINETVAVYIQSVDGTAAELEALSRADPGLGAETFTRPPGLDPEARVQLWGGGTLIFDQFGQAKYHQFKALHDWKRQRERLAYLVRNGLHDSDGRYGFSFGAARGERFAAVHHAAGDAEEGW